MRAFWILADQLLPDHPAIRSARPDDLFLFVESEARSGHLSYHQHKLVLLYSAMRHYAAALKAAGHKVWYHRLEDAGGTYLAALQRFVKDVNPEVILVMEPNEWEMSCILPVLSKKFSIPIETLPSEQFIITRKDFKKWAGTKSPLLMASHYQFQRSRLDILLDSEGKPEGGSWSYDSENRSTAKDFIKSKKETKALRALPHDLITQEVIAQIKQRWSHHPGDADTFWLPVSRVDSLLWLSHFIENNLADFGPFEDAMIQDEPVLYHSVLSPLLNVGLLTPRECIDAALKAYKEEKAPLASVEGFVRQILGWREFVNGIYWLRMPGYRNLNFLKADRPLPAWIDTGETEMNCLRQCIHQARRTGYNHHIQRLMVLGNFFMLSSCEPKEVLRWYMEMYVDAYDWVMQPNVLGMVLHADGGFFATKPYVAGSGYISRMGNYCEGCRYKPELKTGPHACPFNYLYWNFFDRHGAAFKNNRRIGMMLATWEKKTPEEKEKIRDDARTFFTANFP